MPIRRAKVIVKSSEIDEGLDDVAIKSKNSEVTPAETDDIEAIAEDFQGLPAMIRREVGIDAESLLDDPEKLARKEDQDELRYDKSLRKKRETEERNRQLQIQNKIKQEEKYLFEGVSPEEIPAIITGICTFNATNYRTDQLLYAIRKFKAFATDAKAKLKLETDISKLPDPQKIAAIKKYIFRNPRVKINEDSDALMSWSEYIKTIVQICFPHLTFKSTKCNPEVFSSIIIEEVIVPISRFIQTRSIWAWYSNHGDALQRKIAAKLTAIVNNSLKNDLQKKAEKTEKFLESLTEEQRKEIIALVKKIKSLQRKMDRELIRYKVAAKCAKCSVPCCTAEIENLFQEDYLLFLLSDISEKVRSKIWKALEKKNESELCRFLEENGCILPIDSRSHICKVSLCESFGPAREVAMPYEEQLTELFQKLKQKLPKQGE